MINNHIVNSEIENNKINPAETVDLIVKSSIVLISSYFESFMRDVGKEFVMRVENKYNSFEKVPPKLQKFHKNGIRWMNSRLKLYGETDQRTIIMNYASPYYCSENYKLISQMYGDCRSNPSQESIKDALNDMGLNINDIINKDKENKLQGDWLNIFNQNRNKIAHNSKSSIDTTLNDVKEYLEKFKILSKLIYESIDDSEYIRGRSPLGLITAARTCSRSG